MASFDPDIDRVRRRADIDFIGATQLGRDKATEQLVELSGLGYREVNLEMSHGGLL